MRVRSLTTTSGFALKRFICIICAVDLLSDKTLPVFGVVTFFVKERTVIIESTGQNFVISYDYLDTESHPNFVILNPLNLQW